MNILFVNHTFPPHSYAGSELCVLYLAQELQRRGHQPVVFFRYSDPNDEELRVCRGEVEGIAYYAVNNTFRYTRTFQEIYLNPPLAVKFSSLLYQIKPDVVHFHHLTNLSLSLVQEVKRFGCPAVMTLHDYWLHCQRGQLLKPDLSLCHGPSVSACRTCLAVPLLKGNAQRLAQRFWNRAKDKGSSAPSMLSLLDIQNSTIQTPDPGFCKPAIFEIEGKASPVLQAHPPTQITYTLPMRQDAVLKTAVAMHPSTYHQAGSGVVFEVRVHGKSVFQQTVNAKQSTEHRGWIPIEIPLAAHPGRCPITLETRPQDPNDNQHCTAGWREPVIVYKTKPAQSIQTRSARHRYTRSILRSAAYWAAGVTAACSSTATEGIHHRRNWVQRVLDDVDMLISPSLFLRDFFIRQGTIAEKIMFCDNGFLLPESRLIKPPAHPLRFGYIGTWIPSKGVDIAVAAFQGIDPKKAVFIVHGFFPGYDGYEGYEEELKAQAGAAVEFRRKYNPGDVYRLLDEIDCLIVPSIWWENSPMTIHEAFAAGVPVITADVGGMAEQVRNGGGFTFKHRSADSLRAVIHQIIDTPSLLSDRKKTIPVVKSIERFADGILGIYNHCLTHDEPRTSNRSL